MQVKRSLIDPFRMYVEERRPTCRLEDVQPYAAGFTERRRNHSHQLSTKNVDVRSLWVEAGNKVEGQAASSLVDFARPKLHGSAISGYVAGSAANDMRLLTVSRLRSGIATALPVARDPHR